MINKKIVRYCLSVLIIIISWFLFNTISNAASFSASISKSTVNVGDTFTVTVKANNAAGMYNVNSSNSNVSVSSGDESEFLEDGTATITYKAEKAGSTTITASATDMSDLDDDTKTVKGSKSFTVTIKEKKSSTKKNTDKSSSTKTNSDKKESKTSKPSFTSVNEKVYATGSVNVRQSYSTSSAVIGSLSKDESVTRTGKSSEWSKVVYNGQTAYINSAYLTTTKPKEEKKEEENTVEEENTIEEENTVEEENTIEDETEETGEEPKVKLKELLIEGVPLQPEFSSDIYEYTVVLDKKTASELNITATPDDESSNVEIVGNTQLGVGENVVTIIVRSEDGEDITTYQVTVEVPEGAEFSSSDNSDLYKYIGIGIAGLILVIIIIVIIKRRKKDDDFNEMYGDYNLTNNDADEIPNSLKKDKKAELDKDIEEKEESNDMFTNDSNSRRRGGGKHF